MASERKEHPQVIEGGDGHHGAPRPQQQQGLSPVWPAHLSRFPQKETHGNSAPSAYMGMWVWWHRAACGRPVMICLALLQGWRLLLGLTQLQGVTAIPMSPPFPAHTASSLPFHSCWSIINTCHPKFSLTDYSRKSTLQQ